MNSNSNYERGARLTIGRTNHRKTDVIDKARRQCDHLGPRGIKAKRNQTNALFLRQGHLDFWFPSAGLRGKFVLRVEEVCGLEIAIQLRKRRAR